MQETWVQFLGWEDPLAKGMATHSNILAWRIPPTAKRVAFERAQIIRLQELHLSLDPVGEGEGGMFQENSIETCILSRVKQITSPGWMHETSAWTWCTGQTQWDRVETEGGGGIGMGNRCKSMANSCQCMAKTTTIL